MRRCFRSHCVCLLFIKKAFFFTEEWVFWVYFEANFEKVKVGIEKV